MTSGKRIFSDFRVFGRGYFRNAAGLFFGLIFPVILIFIFGAIFSSGFSGTITLYVQNQDKLAATPGSNSTLSPSSLFIAAIKNAGTVNLVMVDNSENFSQYLSTHSASDGIVIPSTFSQDYLSGTSVNVTLYGNPSQSSSSIVSGTVNGVINYFNLQHYNATPVIGIYPTTANAQVTKYIDFLVPGLIGFSILISPMFSMVNISSEYKRTKLFKQLSLTPLSKLEWLASKVLWYILLSTISFLLMVAAGVFVFQADIVLSVWLIPFLVLGPLFFASLGMLVGTISKSTETASVIGNVITFPMMFLSGTFFPISLMPPYLQSFAHVLPLFYIVDGLTGVMIYRNYTQTAIDLVVVAVITIIAFVAAARAFKWRED